MFVEAARHIRWPLESAPTSAGTMTRLWIDVAPCRPPPAKVRTAALSSKSDRGTASLSHAPRAGGSCVSSKSADSRARPCRSPSQCCGHGRWDLPDDPGPAPSPAPTPPKRVGFTVRRPPPNGRVRSNGRAPAKRRRRWLCSARKLSGCRTVAAAPRRGHIVGAPAEQLDRWEPRRRQPGRPLPPVAAAPVAAAPTGASLARSACSSRAGRVSTSRRACSRRLAADAEPWSMMREEDDDGAASKLEVEYDTSHRRAKMQKIGSRSP